MKSLFSFALIALFGGALLLQPKTPTMPLPIHPTIYDTALAMLHEFVAEGNDFRLGFSSADEILRARIDTNAAVDIYYLREDSLLANNLPIDSQLIRLGRRMYPVYVGNTLHSAITFDSTPNGWQPVIFDDSEIIKPYLADKALISELTPLKPPTYAVVEMPFIHTTVTLIRDFEGTHVAPTEVLSTELGEDMPLVPLQPPHKPKRVDDSLFQIGLLHHIFLIQHPR